MSSIDSKTIASRPMGGNDNGSSRGPVDKDSGFTAVRSPERLEKDGLRSMPAEKDHVVSLLTETEETSQHANVLSKTPVPASSIRDQLNLQSNPSSKNEQSTSKTNSCPYMATTDSATTDSGIMDPEVYDTSSSGSQISIAKPEDIRALALKKSTSTSTTESVKSNKSVQSLTAIGTIPLGGLRVHDASNLLNGPACLMSGDVVLITNTKPGMFIGFDSMSFTVGKDGQFRGLRDIPSGAHFLFAGADSSATRHGQWILSKQRITNECGDVHVKRWDSDAEGLDEELSKAEARIQADYVPNFFITLLPYAQTSILAAQPSSVPELWPCLTSCIKGEMLTRVTGRSWNQWRISSTDDRKLTVHRPAPTNSTSHLSERQKEAAENWERLDSPYSKDQVLNFAFVLGTSHVSPEASGHLITEQSLDSSTYVWRVVCDRCNHEDSDEAVGEMQFTFVTGMLLGNLPCIEQWGWIVKCFFKAYQLAMERPIMMRKVIDTFHAQLLYNEQELDGSIFDYEPGLEKEIKGQLTAFKSHLDEMLLEKGAEISFEQEAMGKAFEALETYLWKLDWDLRGNYLRKGMVQLEDGEEIELEMDDFQAEDERGAYAPMVVDLNDDGTEQGVLRWD